MCPAETYTENRRGRACWFHVQWCPCCTEQEGQRSGVRKYPGEWPLQSQVILASPVPSATAALTGSLSDSAGRTASDAGQNPQHLWTLGLCQRCGFAVQKAGEASPSERSWTGLVVWGMPRRRAPRGLSAPLCSVPQ